jgi:hypothetical protein
LVGVIELGDEEEVATGDTRGLDTLANFGLVLIGSGSVDVLVAVLESNLNGLFNSTRFGLPGTWMVRVRLSALIRRNERMVELLTETQGGHLSAGVELHGLVERHFSEESKLVDVVVREERTIELVGGSIRTFLCPCRF